MTTVTDLDFSSFLSLSFLFSGMTLTRTRSVVGRAQIQAFLWKIKLVHTCWTAWSVRTATQWRAVGASTRADARAYTVDPQLSSCRHRFQTGENREKLAHIFRLLGPCFATTTMGKIQNTFLASLSGSLGLVVKTWPREVRRVIFHTTRWTQR